MVHAMTRERTGHPSRAAMPDAMSVLAVRNLGSGAASVADVEEVQGDSREEVESEELLDSSSAGVEQRPLHRVGSHNFDLGQVRSAIDTQLGCTAGEPSMC